MKKPINNNILSRAFFYLSCIFLAASLTSCGGGGGGGTSPTVTIADVSVVEGNSGTTDLVFTLSLSAAAGSSATVNYATSDGTAVAGQDYTAASGSLTVPSGATSATITVTVNTDTNYEADETLTMTLSGPSGLILGTASSATGTITNDDSANPKGYFTGSATVNTSVVINDLIGLAYNNRVLLFSRSGASNVLYDIDLGTITGTDFSGGTVHVYINGLENGETVTVSGTTNDAQITGTFAGGTGLASGGFDVLFDTANNRGASLSRIETLPAPLWTGSVYGIDVANGNFSNNSGDVYVGSDTDGERCGYSGNLGIPVSDMNIYLLSHNIIDGGFATCTYVSTTHTGFASVVDTSTTDDTLVYAFTNGTIALFAVMTH